MCKHHPDKALIPSYPKALQWEAQVTWVIWHSETGGEQTKQHRKSCYILLLLWFGSRWAPSIWTERIPRSRSCWLLLWARIRSRSAASRGMLNVTRTLFQGSTFCTFSLLDSWLWKKVNNISNPLTTRRHGTNKTNQKQKNKAEHWLGVAVSTKSLTFYHLVPEWPWQVIQPFWNLPFSSSWKPWKSYFMRLWVLNEKIYVKNLAQAPIYTHALNKWKAVGWNKEYKTEEERDKFKWIKSTSGFHSMYVNWYHENI